MIEEKIKGGETKVSLKDALRAVFHPTGMRDHHRRLNLGNEKLATLVDGC